MTGRPSDQPFGSRVQQFKSGFELLGSTGLKILEKLGAGCTAREAAKGIGCCKSNVTYWKNKLLDMGALQLQTVDVFKYYQLTPYGSKIIARSECRCFEPVVLEDHAVKFVVVEDEKSRIDWRKLGQPRNWLQLGARIGGVKVEKTSRHLIVHPGKLRGFDVDELEVEAGRIVERVKTVLENRFGMVLSDEGVQLHKPIFRFYSEEAREDVKHGTCIIDGKSSTDNSPPERIPHEEYTGKERARARQLLPDSVQRVELKVDGLQATVAELVEALKPLKDLVGSPRVEIDKKGDLSYVS